MSNTILIILFGLIFIILGYILYIQNSKKQLFINLVSGDELTQKMGLEFAWKELNVGIPVIIFLNSQAVKLALANDEILLKNKLILKQLLNKGATVYVCPGCLKEYTDSLPKEKEYQIINGFKVSNIDLINKDLFLMNTKTLSW